MLVEFKVANFRSFREQQTLSLVASKDKAHMDNLIDCEKFKLLKAAGIYGANASGKSNLISAFRVMEQFVLTSATRMNIGDTIAGIVPFRLDRTSHEKPSSFDIVIIVEGTRYEYGFSATTERVFSEHLRIRRPGGRMTERFDRQFDPKTEKTTWQMTGPLKKDQKLLQEKTRENGLLVSRGAELNISELTPVYLWFIQSVWGYDLSIPPSLRLIQKAAERAYKDSSFRNRALGMMRDADLGISDIDIGEKSALELVEGAPDRSIKNLKDLFQAVSDEEPQMFSVATIHKLIDSKKMVSFNLERDESGGTQRFFGLAIPILRAMDEGSLLVLDEFDCSLHPLLSRKLIELFQSPKVNTKGAQLVFAAHDPTLMDERLFRRDQIWLTEKNQRGATELFSFYDFKKKPRSTEAFQRNYLAGCYGGIPQFGPIFEDLELE